MNDKALKNKRNIHAYPKNHIHEKHSNHLHSKITQNKKSLVICPPKQKPEIPKHYLQVTKKKNTNYVYREQQSYFDELDTQKSNQQMNITKYIYCKNDSQNKKYRKQLSNNAKSHKLKSTIFNKDKNYQFVGIRKQKCRQNLQKNNDQKLQSDQQTIIDNQLCCKQLIMMKLKHTLDEINTDILLGESTKNVKTFEQEINDFQEKRQGIQSKFQSQTLQYLYSKQKEYYDIENYSCYLQKCQPRIKQHERAVIIYWMMDICQGFGSTRQTFASAVCLLDRYLAFSSPITLDQLQLIACGTLNLSNKIDGMKFNSISLSNVTEDIGIDQLITIQQKICTKLNWRLNPPTANMWLNRITVQWDMYLKKSLNLPESIRQNKKQLIFKSQHGQNYINLRTLMQYIDFAIMDIHTLRYHNRELVCSFLYIILTINLKIYTAEQIVELFPLGSQYLREESEINQFYCQFLHFTFSFSLLDLLPTIQYCSTFCILPLRYNLPQIVTVREEQEQMTLQQFYSYQAINQNYLNCLKKRNRKYD